jgi:hypothetical protein
MSKSAPETSGNNPAAPKSAPSTQSKVSSLGEFVRSLSPAWWLEFPSFIRLPPPKENYRFISDERLEQIFQETNATPEVSARIKEDIRFMDYELMRLFRLRDRDAAVSQNRYRLYQIWYIVLATMAGALGSLQALALNADITAVPVFAFFETMIALVATFLATISSREPPLPEWLNNRRRAEHMRREFYRFLMNLPPYDGLDSIARKQKLAQSAADINRGVYPDESSL